MNSREQIQYLEKDWEERLNSDERAALRELDKLLEEFIDAADHNAYPGHYIPLLKRAREAGY